MILTLRRSAESLKALPDKPVDIWAVDERWRGPVISHDRCRECIHRKPDWFCALGRPVQWLDDEIWMATDECDAFKPISVSLRRAQQPTKNGNLVGSHSAVLPVSTGCLD